MENSSNPPMLLPMAMEFSFHQSFAHVPIEQYLNTKFVKTFLIICLNITVS